MDDITVIVQETGSDVYIQIQEDYAPVQSVNGKVGYVTINKSDVGLGNVENISIIAVSGDLQGQINNLDSGYATDAELSGVSGYLDSKISIVSGGLIATGTELNEQINSLSGSVNNELSYVVRVTGDQMVSGQKTFEDTIHAKGGISGFKDGEETRLTLYADALSLGGDDLVIGSHRTVIAGGANNTASGDYDFIGGGSGVTIDQSDYSSSIGGLNNDILNKSNYSVIVGGESNLIADLSTGVTIAGGRQNEVRNSVDSTVVGGQENTVSSSDYAFIGGGILNEIVSSSGVQSTNTLVGGSLNSIEGGSGGNLIGGGQSNSIGDSELSTILAGKQNNITNSIGATLLGDGQSRSKNSQGDHTLTLDFASGVHIPTGEVYISGDLVLDKRPTVNGTGVLLSGEIPIVENVVYTTGDQTVSGIKDFVGNGLRFQGAQVLTGVDLSPYATVANLQQTGQTLSNDIDSLSGSSVLTYGDQTIGGDKIFTDTVRLNNLYVTGVESIINTQNFNVQSPFLLLNITGGALDGGVFFVTGETLTGINDSGAIIGFDHSDKFKFGIASRSDDLAFLPDIASVQDIEAYSGFAQNTYVRKDNLERFITGINTGVETYSAVFSSSFSEAPVVVASVQSTGGYTYGVNVASVTSTGFSVDFSDAIQENGVILNVLAY